MKLPLSAATITLLCIAGLAPAAYFPLWVDAPITASDSESYFEVARDLRDGTLERLHFRPIGYPAFLALTGSFEYPTRGLFMASLLVHGLSIAALASVLLALRFKSGIVFCFVAVLLLPPFLEPTTRILSETLCGLFLIAGVVGILVWFRRGKVRWTVLAALCLAIAALVKPTYQLVGFLPAILILGAPRESGDHDSPERRKAAAAFGLTFLGVLTVYAAFNFIRFDYFGLSRGNLAWSLSTKTVSVIERLPDELEEVREILIEVRNLELTRRHSSHTAEQYFDNARARLRHETQLSESELDDLLLNIQFMLIAKAPMTYLSKTFRALGDFWLPTNASFSNGGSRVWQAIWSLIHFVLIGVFLLQLVVFLGGVLLEVSRTVFLRRSSGVGASRALKQSIFAYALPACVVAYTFLVSTIVHHGEARFRTPVDPMIIFMIVVGARIWWHLLGDSLNECDVKGNVEVLG